MGVGICPDEGKQILDGGIQGMVKKASLRSSTEK
jgi:hypothetical protein